MDNSVYIGIDAGSVSVKFARINESGSIISQGYLLHNGNPLSGCENLLNELADTAYNGLCVTGSARKIVGKSVSADLIKNEITALHAGVIARYPNAQTIFEIGGQDSKLLSIRDGEIFSFRLNSVCAAGTGSFLQQQSNRLGIDVTQLSDLTKNSAQKARFSGRCTVFVETEMINLQQKGFTLEAIAGGLADAVVDNYLRDCSPGITLLPEYIFCGGVASIDAIKNSFEEKLNAQIIVPSYHRIASAYGAAILAREWSHLTENNFPRKIRFSRLTDSETPKIQNNCIDCLNCGKCGK